MRTFSIRLDEELFQKLESGRGEKPRADYIREVLILHFKEPDANLSEPQTNHIKEIDSLKVELAHKEEIIKIMDDRVKDLQNHNGFLISEYSRLTKLNEQLLLSPAPTEPIKKWWQIWKK
jgi:predicted DNA-binding protein